MNIPWKKILILLGFIAIVVFLAYLIYTLFFKAAVGPRPAYVPPGQELKPGELPTIVNANLQPTFPTNVNAGLPGIGRIPGPISQVARGGLTEVQRLTDKAIKGATLSADGSLIFYDPVSGKFYKRLASGAIIELSGKVFHDVDKVTWTKDANKAILEYPDGSNILYDFSQSKQTTLPKALQDFAFSNNGSQIASEVIGPSSENNWLITANPNGTGIKFIEPVGDKADEVDTSWSPNNQVVATFRDSYDADREEIIFIGQNEENFKSLVAPGSGFRGQWTASGEKMLYSVSSAADGFRPKLWLVNAQGDNIGLNNTSLNLNTWADKCAVSTNGQGAYCAVPRELPEGAGWYPELAKDVPDDFYYVDLETGIYSLLAVPADASYSASQVMVSPDEKSLYFIDQTDNNVYSINLP